MGYGGLVLDTAGQVLLLNDPAASILQRYGGVSNEPETDRWRPALKTLLRSGEAARFRLDENAWVVLRREGGQPLVLHAIPLPGSDPAGSHTLVILVDLQEALSPRREALQKIFAFTPAEAGLAAEIAEGRSPDEIAEIRGVAVGTVRKQLASVFTKTGTGRQSELVALLSRASILP